MSSRKQDCYPPEILERLVEWIVPPACREHFLGDLSERYSSPGQYIKDVVRTLPLVICSRIWRTFDKWLLFAQGFVLLIAFLAPYNAGYGSFIAQMLIPVGSALAITVFRDAYAPEGKRSTWSQALDVLFAVLGIVASQAVLGLVRPQWLLSPLGFRLGLMTGAPILFLLRRAMSGVARKSPELGVVKRISAEQLRRRAGELYMRILCLDFATLIFVFFWGVMGQISVTALDLITRVNGMVILAAAAYLLVRRVYQRGWDESGRWDPQARHSLSAYRRQLQRMRDDQRKVWLLRGAPILVSMLSIALRASFSQKGIPFVVFAFVYCILQKEMSDRQARKYEEEIDEIDSMDGFEQQQ